MSDRELRDRMHTLVLDEPPMRLDLAAVVNRGQSLRRRRHLGVAGATFGLAAAVGAAVLVPTVVLGGGQRESTLAVQPGDGGSSADADDEQLTPKQRAIAAAIRGSSPADWTFELGPDRWDGYRSLEATADDGSGPGRLTIGISPYPGTQQVTPCRDPEFAQGVTCEATRLRDGRVLSMRAEVTASGPGSLGGDQPVKYVDVVVTHPDGTGVMAESANFVLDWPLPDTITPTDKRDLAEVTRDDPTYTVEQLAAVVLAVDEAVHG